MTGPSRCPETRPLGVGHRHVALPSSCVPKCRLRARSRGIASGDVEQLEACRIRPATSRSGFARRQRRPPSPLRGGLRSTGCRVVAVQHSGTGLGALLVSRPPPLRQDVGPLVTITPLPEG